MGDPYEFYLSKFLINVEFLKDNLLLMGGSFGDHSFTPLNSCTTNDCCHICYISALPMRVAKPSSVKRRNLNTKGSTVKLINEVRVMHAIVQSVNLML